MVLGTINTTFLVYIVSIWFGDLIIQGNDLLLYIFIIRPNLETKVYQNLQDSSLCISKPYPSTYQAKRYQIPIEDLRDITMKKTFFYNFFPAKDEEIKAAIAVNAKNYISYEVIEIRELGYQPLLKPNDPWHIKKVVESEEIKTGILRLSWRDTLDHIFRYWDVVTANLVTNKGKKIYVEIVVDTSDPSKPFKAYQGENINLQKTSKDEFVYDFVLKDVVVDRPFRSGDLIGLTWDYRYGIFQTKVLSRGNAARDAIILD